MELEIINTIVGCSQGTLRGCIFSLKFDCSNPFPRCGVFKKKTPDT